MAKLVAFGMFEQEKFAEGTKKFIPQLKRLTDAGIKVYIGGGEGGKHVEQYGQPDWVTYCWVIEFTGNLAIVVFFLSPTSWFSSVPNTPLWKTTLFCPTSPE